MMGRWFQIICFLIFLNTNAFAGSITLSWYSAENADGYLIFYGEKSGIYEEPIDVHNVVEYTMELDIGKMKFFAIKSYNRWGRSEFSEEASLSAKTSWRTITWIK